MALDPLSPNSTQSEDSNKVQVLDSDELLVVSSSVPQCIQDMDSNKPLEQANLSDSTAESIVKPVSGSCDRVRPCAEVIHTRWNFKKVLRLMGTNEAAVRFMEENGFIPTSKMCNYHRKPMTIIRAGQLGAFR